MRIPAISSVRGKLVYMGLSTTFAALLVASIAMTLYDLRSFQQTWVDDLTTQAEILASVSAPALVFDDPKATQEDLAFLRIRPQILAGAIYTAAGKRFASYTQPQAGDQEFPDKPGPAGHRIEKGELVVHHPVIEHSEVIGWVYLRARYPLIERLKSYLLILAAVMAGSLMIAALVASRLQATITKPIRVVTNVAREVMQRRDYTARVPKTTNDEIGILVDSFNGMLEEVDRRARAIQEANRTLENEMAVRHGAEKALRDADRRKDEFLATLAHELRNPLAPLSAGLDILELTAGDPVAGKRARDVMARQLRQMVRLVDDLLDVSRITTGKLGIRKERVILQDVVGAALETIGPFVKSHDHSLGVDMPASPIVLEGDATRLAQVVSNLLHNAAKYTNPGGSISLGISMEGKQAVIQVSDNGIGIARDMLPQVFDMFTQADYSLERSRAGLGVGLTLAKRLVELHGGTITVQSEGAGRGSRFTVRLPLSPENHQDDSRPDASGVNDTASYRILLADDNVDFATSMGVLLRALGHKVHVTHDGVEALAAAAWFKPEFAFLDIGMPKLNGYGLARSLRNYAATRSAVLIAVTGWGQEKDRRLAQDAGFDHHIVKPAGLEQFCAILRTKSER
jgi:two-component system, sensor histidine kinase